VNLTLLVDAGYAADPIRRARARVSRSTCWAKGRRGAPRCRSADTLSQLGREPRHRSLSNVSSVSLSTLRENLDPALDVFADVVLIRRSPQPTSSGSSGSAWRASSARSTAGAMGLRVFAAAVRGIMPYGQFR